MLAHKATETSHPLSVEARCLPVAVKTGKADNSELGSFAMFDGGRRLSLFDEPSR